MSLISSPRRDGSGIRDIQVDFPYYLNKRSAKYFQKQSLDEARAAAQRHIEFATFQGAKNARAVEHPEKQSIYVYYEME